jgi:hypothetical protein
MMSLPRIDDFRFGFFVWHPFVFFEEAAFRFIAGSDAAEHHSGRRMKMAKGSDALFRQELKNGMHP